MKSSWIEQKFLKLPPEKQREVEEFIDDLLKNINEEWRKKSGKSRAMFGALKGTITMSEDFDEPMEDFKEYM